MNEDTFIEELFKRCASNIISMHIRIYTYIIYVHYIFQTTENYLSVFIFAGNNGLTIESRLTYKNFGNQYFHFKGKKCNFLVGTSKKEIIFLCIEGEEKGCLNFIF